MLSLLTRAATRLSIARRVVKLKTQPSSGCVACISVLTNHYCRYSSASFLGFKSPNDLVLSARKAIETSEQLQLLLLDSDDASRSLRYTDDISNALCLVADAASAIQNISIGADWDDACSAAMHSVESCMRSLNVNVRIYEKLLSFSQRGLLSESEESVLGLFVKDFEDSVVHLPLQQRQAMQSLLQRECYAAEAYLASDRSANAQHILISPPKSTFSFPPKSAQGRRVSSNFSEVVSLLQQAEAPAARAEVRVECFALLFDAIAKLLSAFKFN
jgi:hypothetical protein